MIVEPLTQWIALAGAAVVAVMFVREVIRWYTPGSVLVRPMQRKLRLAEVILIEVIFAMVFAGPVVVGKSANPLAVLLYWTVCIFIALAVLLIAAFDLLSITKGYRRYTRRMFGEFEEDDQEKK